MGLWDRVDLWRHRFGLDCVFHGRDVSLNAAVTLGTYVVKPFAHRMYDRGVKPIPERPYSGFKYRVHTLLGTTGWKMAKYRGSVWDSISSVFRVAWRPHLLMALIYEVMHSLQAHRSQAKSICVHPGHGFWVLHRHHCVCRSQLFMIKSESSAGHLCSLFGRAS